MKIEVEIKNKQELLQSLNRELASVSKEITERHSQNILDKKNGELATIQRQIIEAKSQLDETLATHEIHKKNIQNDLAGHREAIKAHEEKVKELQSKQHEADHKARYHDSMVGDSIEKLQSLSLEIEKVSKELEKKKQEVVVEQTSLDFLNSRIAEAHKSLDGLNDLLSIGSAQLQKDIDDLTSQKRDLETQIVEKRNSLEGYEENKKIAEEEFARKQSDLSVLEKRLINALESSGVPFKL